MLGAGCSRSPLPFYLRNLPNIPPLRYSAPLATPLSPSTPPKLARAAVNVESCAQLNPDFHTLYYDDAAVIAAISRRLLPTLAADHPSVHTPMAAAWARLTTDLALSQPFVLKADLFRLAIVWLDGGWWLDADARCTDPITETLAGDAVLAELKASHARARMAAMAAAGGSDCHRTSCTANPTTPGCTGDHREDTREEDGEEDGGGPIVTAGCVLAWEGEPPAENRPGKFRKSGPPWCPCLLDINTSIHMWMSQQRASCTRATLMIHLCTLRASCTRATLMIHLCTLRASCTRATLMIRLCTLRHPRHHHHRRPRHVHNRAGKSSPLNWAFGCRRRHPLLLVQ